jgi:hypothetical protein
MLSARRLGFPRTSCCVAALSTLLVTACAASHSVAPSSANGTDKPAASLPANPAPARAPTRSGRFEPIFEMPNDRIRAVSTSGDLVLVLAQMAYFRSVDRGRTFQKLPLPFPNPLAIATGSDKLVYLGGQRCGLARSVDGGQTFQVLRTPSANPFCAVDSIVVGPDPNLWIASSSPASIARSSDQGSTFQSKPLDGEPAWATLVRTTRDEAMVFGQDAKLDSFLSAVDGQGKKLRALPLLPGAKYETVCASKGSLFASTDRGILRAKEGAWSTVLAKAGSSGMPAVLACGEQAIVVASYGPSQSSPPEKLPLKVSTSKDLGESFTEDTFDVPVHWQSGVDLGATWTPGAPPPTSSTPTFPKIAALYVAGTGETYVGLTDAIPGQKFESMQLYGSLLFRRAP